MTSCDPSSCGGNCIEVQHYKDRRLLKVFIFPLQWPQRQGLGFVNQILMTKHLENSCKFMTK